MLFAVSGDSCRQLLLAWFLRPATAAPGPYDAGKEASRVSWTGGSPALCRAVGQPSVWGPVPLPAAAFPLLCPARQAFPSLRLLAGGRPAPWPRHATVSAASVPQAAGLPRRPLCLRPLLPSDSFSPKSKSLSTRCHICHIWKKPVKLIPTKTSRLKPTAAYSAFSTMHLRPSPGCQGRFIRGFLQQQRNNSLQRRK